MVLGVGAGGTFIDFVAYDGHGFRVHKVLSTPEAPERVILAGIEALGLWCAIAVTIDGFVESGCRSKLSCSQGGVAIDASVVKYHDI